MLIRLGASRGSISNSRRFAWKYSSMSAWKSRWSRVRLVKTPAANVIASTRRSDRACDDTSIAQARQPRRPSRAASPAAPAPPASCASRHADLIANAVSDRAEEAAAKVGGVEDRRHEVRRRRLAVRAGDADDLHLAARMAVERRGEHGERQPRVVDNRPDDLRVRRRRLSRTRPPRRRGRWPGARTPCRRRAGLSARRTRRLAPLRASRTRSIARRRPLPPPALCRQCGPTPSRGARRAARPRSWLAASAARDAEGRRPELQPAGFAALEGSARWRVLRRRRLRAPTCARTIRASSSVRIASRALRPRRSGIVCAAGVRYERHHRLRWSQPGAPPRATALCARRARAAAD